MKQSTNAYPTLPLDSERILRARQRCQKPREQEEIWSWFVLRRVTVYVTLLLNRTPFTPNGVSWFSIGFFLLTGWLIAIGETWSHLLAVVTYNTGYACDCIDGELARLRNTTSRRGVFLDTLIRACSIPIVASIGLALVRWHEVSFGETSLVYGIVVMSTMALLVPLAFHLTYSEGEGRDPVGDMRVQSRRAEWLAFFLGLPGFFAVLPIAVAGEVLLHVPVMIVFFTVFLSLFSLKTLLRLYITYRYVK